MAEKRIQRRLAAILAADVVGYSRLMEADEEATLRLFKTYREIIDGLISRHDGRVFSTAGDSVMAEFGSAIEAVRAAVSIQEELEARNEHLPEESKLMLRIGVNLGDIMIDGDDLYGDGVNVAARLEGLCAPGEVYVSGSVHGQVAGKLSLAIDEMGEHAVKNIARPIAVYRLRTGAGKTMGQDAEPKEEPPRPSHKPTIAVLPFQNMSGDPEQEYFADGIAEDIITALSRFRWFFVIARNSSFTYKGRAVDVKQVSRDLGVQYVLEGSVRRGGDRVRITAQLIDAMTGRHIWAERYDRDLHDIFSVQDEITEAIAAAVAPAFSSAEERRAKLKAPHNLDAWDSTMRGMSMVQSYKKEEAVEAQRFFERAMELDPDFGPAYVGYAISYAHGARLGFFDRSLHEKALSAARRAVALDYDDAWAHAALGVVHFTNREHDAAIEDFEDAIRLNPSLITAHYYLGRALISSGRSAEAIPHIEQTIRISPRDPNRGHFYGGMARAYLFLNQHEKAIESAKQGLRYQNIQWSLPVTLAAALGHLGKERDARSALAHAERLCPGVTIRFVRDHLPISDATDMEHMLDGLRKAGMPE